MSETLIGVYKWKQLIIVRMSMRRRRQYACLMKHGHEPNRRHDTLPRVCSRFYCQVIFSSSLAAIVYIAPLTLQVVTLTLQQKIKFLLVMLIGGFDRTCFMTVLHRCASHKVRLLVIQGFGSVFFKNRRETKSIGLTYNPSIRKERGTNLKDSV